MFRSNMMSPGETTITIGSGSKFWAFGWSWILRTIILTLFDIVVYYLSLLDIIYKLCCSQSGIPTALLLPIWHSFRSDASNFHCRAGRTAQFVNMFPSNSYGTPRQNHYHGWIRSDLLRVLEVINLKNHNSGPNVAQSEFLGFSPIKNPFRVNRGSYCIPKQWVVCFGVSRARVPRGSLPGRVPWTSPAGFLRRPRLRSPIEKS